MSAIYYANKITKLNVHNIIDRLLEKIKNLQAEVNDRLKKETEQICVYNLIVYCLQKPSRSYRHHIALECQQKRSCFDTI